jgi:hypothetical protein
MRSEPSSNAASPFDDVESCSPTYSNSLREYSALFTNICASLCLPVPHAACRHLLEGVHPCCTFLSVGSLLSITKRNVKLTDSPSENYKSSFYLVLVCGCSCLFAELSKSVRNCRHRVEWFKSRSLVPEDTRISCICLSRSPSHLYTLPS